MSVKGYQPPPFQNHRPITRIPPFQIGYPKFSLLTEMQLKLSSVNSIQLKQQHNVGFLIFKVTLKYMLSNGYIDEIHARQCLCIMCLYCREGFSHAFNFFVVSKGILHAYFQKQLGKKDFSTEQLPIASYMLLCKQKNPFQLINKLLVFNFIII